MTGLWADGWFYISALGLLVSGSLFFYLLGQYRAALEAADEAHVDDATAEASAETVVRPIYIPDEPEPAKTVPLPSVAPPSEKPAAAAPAPAPEPPAAAKPGSSAASGSSGGLSPAFAYLQNLKEDVDAMAAEMKGIGKNLAAVTESVAAISERDEALIERLAELARAIEDLKAVAASPAPEPVKAPAPAKAPETAPAAEPPKIELGHAPGVGAPAAPSPEATIRLDEFKAALGTEEKPAEDEPSGDKPRRGPVWPV